MRGGPSTVPGGTSHHLTAAISWRGEAFFPDGNPYLGRTVRQEPVRQANVLSLDRRHQ